MTAQLFLEENLQALKAEYVAPLVVYLGHESCQETGKVFEAGAGWFGQSQFSIDILLGICKRNNIQKFLLWKVVLLCED